MSTFRNPFRQVLQVTRAVMMLAAQTMRGVWLSLRSRIVLAAEEIFLKQQLVLYQEHNAKWRRDLIITRLTLVWLSYWFDWQPAFTIAQPKTFKRWRCQELHC